MQGNIKLYIGGDEVDLSQDLAILFTYSVDELTNPTVVKNTYSKTVVIEDTPNNSRIFGQFWNVQRIQQTEGQYGISFNPSKRVPFAIYVNGDIYQEGYAKLLNVKTKGKNNTYEVSLFGGLGSFFFNLSYLGDNTEDNKRKLSDLRYMPATSTPSEREFDFTIKKETIQSAWANLDADENSMWHHINFAPCYNGLPDDFDADKVLMNFGSTAATSADTSTAPVRRPGSQGAASLPTKTATTDGSFALYDGYTLAELPKEYTADEMREFRSYLMRPCLRVKSVIEACCDPENNGGYEVDLDPTFFTDSNPYWSRAYMTLPLLTELDFSGNEGDDQTGVTATIGTTATGGSRTGTEYKETTTINLGEISAASSFNFSMDVNIQALVNALPSGYKTHDEDWQSDQSVTGGMYMSPQAIYPCAYSAQNNVMYPGTIIVQLVAYSLDGKVIAGTDMYNCTSGYNPHRTNIGGRGGATVVSTYVPNPNDFKFDAEFYAGYITKNGSFNYVSGSTSSTTTWQMADTLTFNLKKLPKTCSLKLIVTKVNGTSQNYTNKAMCLFQRFYVGNPTSYSTYYRNPATINRFQLVVSNVNVSINSDKGIRTGAKFTKADLLNTDYSPADFFLSYMKLFGMYITKDRYQDTIHVMTRNTFYRKENVIDLSDKIDISKEVKITPLVFDAKWYTFKLEGEDTLFSEQYKATYGNEYGSQRVNTGYNFDASEKKLYENSVFKAGIECLEKSEVFTYVSADTSTKPWMYDGFEYPLYKTDDYEETVNIEIQPRIKNNSLKSFNPAYKYYDLFSKLQCHGEDNAAADGSNILMFYNGSVLPKTSTDEDVNYWITDDNSYMAILNDNTPCWLWTTKQTDVTEQTIALKVTEIPHFTRYFARPEVGYIQQSWDFGVPKQLYIPTYTTDYDSTLYTNYWRSYLADMYDVNTKMLTAYVKLDNTPAEEWLRDFYWFRNCIWRINKIEDADVLGKSTTKVEFVKVEDMNNYSNVDVSSIPTISISASTTEVTNNGGNVTIYVTVSDGGQWWVSDYVYNAYSASTYTGYGSGSFGIRIPANLNNYTVIHHISVSNEYGQWAHCEIIQRNATFTVEQFAQYKDTNVPWTGGTCLYKVTATYPWTATTDSDFVTLYRNVGNPGITNLEATWDASTLLAERNTKITCVDSAGNVVEVYKWQDRCKGLVFPYSGSTQSVNFLSGCEAVYPDWLTVVDNGNDTYNVTAIANPELSARTCSIMLSDSSGNSGTVEVYQYAGVVFNVNRIDGTGNILAAGGSVTLEIVSNGSWSGVSDSAWCTLGLNSGSTSATFTVSATTNEDITRKATLTFTHESGDTVVFEVTQSGIGTDDFSNPTALIFPGSGGTDTFDILTQTDTWQIVGKPSWVTVSSTAGTGTATITVNCDASNMFDRYGSIVIWDQTKNKTYVVSVSQETGNVFIVSPTAMEFPGSGGTSALTISTPGNWSIAGKPSWVNVSSTGGTGNATVTVSVGQSMDWERSGSLIVADLTQNVTHVVAIQQATGDVFKVARVNGSGDIPAIGGPNNVCYLEVTSPNHSWTATTTDNFISFQPTGYTASTGVYVTFDENTGTTRTATITFNNGITSITYTQTQAGYGQASLVVPNALIFSASGGTAETQTVTVNIPNTWQIVGRPSWITASPESGSSSGMTVSVTAIPYSGTVQRQGSLVFADMTTNQVSIVTCIQNAGEGEILAVSPSSLRFNASGGTATLTIIANTDWTIA